MFKTANIIAVLIIITSANAIAFPGDTVGTRIYGSERPDYCVSAIEVEDGDLVIAGYTETLDNGDTDIWIFKLNSVGDILWDKTYGSDANETAYDLDRTADGGFIIMGDIKAPGADDRDIYVLRLDSNGDSLWSMVYDSDLDSDAGALCPAVDGGYIMTGSLVIQQPDSIDIFLMKTDINGDSLWSMTYGGEQRDWAYDMEVTEDSAYFILGRTESFGSGGTDYYLLKVDSLGNEIWSMPYGTTDFDNPFSLCLTGDGGCILAGSSYGLDTNYDDYYIVRVDSLGNEVWSSFFGGELYERANAVHSTPDGNYLVSGGTTSFGEGSWEYYVVKFSPDGDSIWSRSYGTTDYDFLRYSLTLSEYNYLLVGTTGHPVIGNPDAYLIKVEGALPSPAVVIDIIPDDTPPLYIPRGSSFSYTGELTNVINRDVYTDVWIRARHIPTNEYYGPRTHFDDIFLTAGQTFSYYPVIQDIHPMAPLGEFNYIVYCGDYPTLTPEDSNYIEVVITEADGNLGDGGWDIYGWGNESPDYVILPSRLAGRCYPNPFNARSNLEIYLPEEGMVKLDVYDIMGRKVETLANGFMAAGKHIVAWDASAYSSGIYFYRINAGTGSITEKIVLIK